MTIAAYDLLQLKTHIFQKLDNRKWLLACMNGNSSAFPYRALGREATIAKSMLSPKEPPTLNPAATNSVKPLYLVNIPLAHRPQENLYGTLQNLLELFKNEAFGKNEAESKEEIKNRFSLVIGANQIKSLDAKVNQEFREWVRDIPQIEGIAYRIIGFFWKPNWILSKPDLIFPYSAKKSFILLSCLSSDAALKVRTAFEGTLNKLHSNIIDQIPYQRIRETIKTSRVTTDFMNELVVKNPNSCIYYGVMDSDALHLKTDAGLFSRYDDAITNNAFPSALTLGYRVEEPNRPLIELGVKLDMACRAAMNSVLSYGAYFPEPSSIFCVKKFNESSTLTNLTFYGNGRGLENRRLIQNGVNRGILKKDAVFIADGGVTTTTPTRMITEKNSKVTTIKANTLKNKSNLQSLRDISQSHIFPKNWADNLYLALGTTVSQVTDVTGPMMTLFSIYDPISRMMNIKGRFSHVAVDTVITNYEAPLSRENEIIRLDAKKILENLKIDKALVNKIELAAIASGKAILKVLVEAMR